jgi:hypothetical protein
MKNDAGFNCCWCGDDVDARRWAIGIRSCMVCGEAAARAERASWCVVQEYGKGNYVYVSAETAREKLRQTNQKQPR